jgi:FkbM family methyltransferase
VAFEPNPDAREGLERHVQLNHLADRVEIVPFAVAAHAGEEDLYTAGAAVESRLRVPNEKIADRASVIRVKVVTLDDWCEGYHISPDWLLIDIEGFEIAALKGARRLISARRNQLGIVVEMHPQFWAAAGMSRADAESVLNELGMRPIPLTGQTDPLGEYGLVHLAYT